MPPSETTKGSRRSLSHVGGDITTAGDRDAAEMLARALDVAPSTEDEDRARAHVHGFHTYPARMHPDTAAGLVKSFAPARGRVLDPFCGSGTVLVEAMILGRDVVGTDLNPLAILLARWKTSPPSEAESVTLLETARRAAAHADTRRKQRAGATRRYPDDDVSAFAPHVLLELDSLRAFVAGLPSSEARARDGLLLVLSSILVKVSKKTSDTSALAPGAPEPRIAAGYTARLFVKKTEEVTRRAAELTRLLPSPPPRAIVLADDATELATGTSNSIDAVITSPPYAATYDYLAQHALRLRWLGLDARALEAGELGARRRYQDMDAPTAERAWVAELTRFLTAVGRVVKKGAPVVLLMADSAVGATALRADDLVDVASKGTPLVPLARATQVRPHFHRATANAFRDAPRCEHALLLVRS
jgi:DNA methylase